MNIEKIVEDLKPQMAKDKEYLWNHPEKGLNEFKTSEYILKRLKEMEYTDINNNIYATGIIATLKGKEEGPCILFRTDMDAVVMDETGRTKHACGHDAHMTIMLSLAKILIDNQNKIKGTVKLLFQPDEEGNAGAKFMVQNGALENPKVDKAFAIHVWGQLKEDTIAIKEGTIMASSDPFDVIVYGKGGHAAMPENCIDPIYIANKIGIALKEMAKIKVEPEERAVLGITAISGGKTNNVIPDKVYMKGICRTNNNDVRKRSKKELQEKIESIAKDMGGKAEVKFLVEYPVTVNSEKEAEELQELATKVVNNVDTTYQTTASEDFSYYLEKVPGAMMLVGCGREEFHAQHSEDFSVGENAILIGTQMFYEIVKKYLM